MELTPDTSFTSIDENDLTEMYDQFSNQVPHLDLEENRFDDIQLNPTDQFGRLQSTPKKGKKRDGVRSGTGEGVIGGREVVKVMSVNVRKDVQALLKLATDLQISSLKMK